MDRFPEAFKRLMDIEKGFVNDKDDKGGATKYGVTIVTLSAYMGRQATVDDVRGLALIDAERIYRVLFWEKLSLDDVKDFDVAYCIFDQAVNRGETTAVRLLQKSLNKNLSLTDLKEDGLLGYRTIALVNDQPPEFVGMWFCEECQLAYVRVCEYNQTQLKFLRGWLDRTHKMQRLFWDKI